MSAKAISVPVAAQVVDAVTSAIGAALDGSLGWLMHQFTAELASSTAPQLGAAWFLARLQTMKEVAVVAVLPLVLVSIAQAVWRQDGRALARTVGVQLPLAALATMVLAAVAQELSSWVDAASNYVGAQAGFDPHALAATVLGRVVMGSLPPYVALLLVVLALVAVLLLWLELVCRSAAISAAMLFMPLALAGLVWPATAVWARRLAETLVALILSKLAITAVLSAGTFALASSSASSSPGRLIGGAALMAISALAPFAILRLLPGLEGAVQIEGLGRAVLSKTAQAGLWGSELDLGDGEDLRVPPYEPPLAQGEEPPEQFRRAFAIGFGGAWASGSSDGGTEAGPPPSPGAQWEEAPQFTSGGEGPHDGPGPQGHYGPPPAGRSPEEDLPEGWTDTEWRGEGDG